MTRALEVLERAGGQARVETEVRHRAITKPYPDLSGWRSLLGCEGNTDLFLLQRLLPSPPQSGSSPSVCSS